MDWWPSNKGRIRKDLKVCVYSTHSHESGVCLLQAYHLRISQLAAAEAQVIPAFS